MRISARRNPERGGAMISLIILVVVVVLCAIVYWARHPIMRFAAESWVIDEPAARADALLLLGDDNFYADRATRAAEMIRHGVAPLVVASGRRLRPSAGVAELQEHDLIERGVPKDKIIPVPTRCRQHVGRSHGTGSTVHRAALSKRDRCDVELSRTTGALHFSQGFSAGDRGFCGRRARWGFRPRPLVEKRKSEELFVHEFVGMVVAFREGAERRTGEK